jgi:uncharacterized iron-regulated membrane protein
LTHRWSALVLGLVLLIVTTSGIPLLYEQEITRARHAAVEAVPDHPCLDGGHDARDTCPMYQAALETR